MKLKLIVTATLFTLDIALAHAGLEEGMAAYQRGDYATAKREFRPLAEGGNAAAQFTLGFMFANGQGLAKDEAEAVKWYRKAAQQGDANAQINLGFMYETGQGVAKDEAEAVKWYRKAAEQGLADAQFNLGLAYETGRGGAKDEAEAVKWYRKAAQQGDADAQVNLGRMYETGRGVAKNDAEAVKWFRRAAEQGVAAAQYNLGVLYAKGQGVAKDEAEAVKWYRKAAEQGSAQAQAVLEQMKLRAGKAERPGGQTGAGELLRRDIIAHIAFLEDLAGHEGFQGRVLKTRQLIASRELIPGKARVALDSVSDAAAKRGRARTGWNREEWLIDRNGKKIYYEIILIEGIDGGTEITAGRIQDAPFSK